MSVVGLDFGNKNVAIAAAGRGGVDVVLNGNSNRLNVRNQLHLLRWRDGLIDGMRFRGD